MSTSPIRKNIAFALALSVCLFAAPGISHAQDSTEEQAQVSYTASRNHAGIMNYCLEKSYIDAETAETSKTRIAQQVKEIPSDTEAGDAAEAKGKKGILIFEDGSDESNDRKLDDVAADMGVTPDIFCQTAAEAETIQ